MLEHKKMSSSASSDKPKTKSTTLPPPPVVSPQNLSGQQTPSSNLASHPSRHQQPAFLSQHHQNLGTRRRHQHHHHQHHKHRRHHLRNHSNVFCCYRCCRFLDLSTQHVNNRFLSAAFYLFLLSVVYLKIGDPLFLRHDFWSYGIILLGVVPLLPFMRINSYGVHRKPFCMLYIGLMCLGQLIYVGYLVKDRVDVFQYVFHRQYNDTSISLVYSEMNQTLTTASLLFFTLMVSSTLSMAAIAYCCAVLLWTRKIWPLSIIFSLDENVRRDRIKKRKALVARFRQQREEIAAFARRLSQGKSPSEEEELQEQTHQKSQQEDIPPAAPESLSADPSIQFSSSSVSSTTSDQPLKSKKMHSSDDDIFLFTYHKPSQWQLIREFLYIFFCVEAIQSCFRKWSFADWRIHYIKRHWKHHFLNMRRPKRIAVSRKIRHKKHSKSQDAVDSKNDTTLTSQSLNIDTNAKPPLVAPPPEASTLLSSVEHEDYGSSSPATPTSANPRDAQQQQQQQQHIYSTSLEALEDPPQADDAQSDASSSSDDYSSEEDDDDDAFISVDSPFSYLFAWAIPVEFVGIYDSFTKFIYSAFVWRVDFFFSSRFISTILCGVGASFLSCAFIYVGLYTFWSRMKEGFTLLVSACEVLNSHKLPIEVSCPLSEAALQTVLDLCSQYTYYMTFVSCIATFLFMCILFFLMLIEYRSKILRMRRGRDVLTRGKANLFNASRLIGYQAAFAAVGSVLITVLIFAALLFLGLLVLVCVVFPQTVLDLLFATPFLQFIVSGAVVAFFRLIVIRIMSLFVVRHGKVIRRRAFDFFEIIMTIYSTFSGAAICIFWRLLIPFGMRLAEIARVDRSGLTHGYHKDASFVAYLAALRMDHYYSNPILLLMFDCIEQDIFRHQKLGLYGPSRLKILANRLAHIHDKPGVVEASDFTSTPTKSSELNLPDNQLHQDTEKSKMPKKQQIISVVLEESESTADSLKEEIFLRRKRQIRFIHLYVKQYLYKHFNVENGENGIIGVKRKK